MKVLSMLKKSLSILLLAMITPLFSACQKGEIVTSTGSLGQRAEKLKHLLPNDKPAPKERSGVIYLGREYENNQFGPAAVKFVFER